MFRNLTAFLVPLANVPAPADLAEALAEHPLRDPGALELATEGWISPMPGRGQDALTRTLGQDTLIALGTCSRILPAQVVQEALAEKLDQLEVQRGRRPGGKERQRIKDEIITELMPRAFLKRGRTLAWLDHGAGLLVVDTASRKAAEAVVHHLRDALLFRDTPPSTFTFPATPLLAGSSARIILTEWVVGGFLPDQVTLGDEAELRDPGDDGAIVRCRHQDMAAEEVLEHYKSGKQVVQLAITFDRRLQCVLAEDLTVRKLRFEDVVTDQLGDVAGEDATAELDARFALMTGELRRLFAFLAEHFDTDHSTLKLDGGQAPPDGLAVLRQAARQAADRLRQMAAEDGIGVTIECSDGEKFEIAPVPTGPKRQGRKATGGKGAPA